jgi:hypothetical protein
VRGAAIQEFNMSLLNARRYEKIGIKIKWNYVGVRAESWKNFDGQPFAKKTLYQVTIRKVESVLSAAL